MSQPWGTQQKVVILSEETENQWVDKGRVQKENTFSWNFPMGVGGWVPQWAILKQYQQILVWAKHMHCPCGISDRVAKEIEIRKASNHNLIAKHTKVTKSYGIYDSRKFDHILYGI